jgi:hypothetical protein
MQQLKNQMNKLEQQTPGPQNLKTLNLKIERLNKLTDSQITHSKIAWQEYRKLEQECQKCTQCRVQLDNLKTTCKNAEELAADLLCYSLGRFRQTKEPS